MKRPVNLEYRINNKLYDCLRLDVQFIIDIKNLDSQRLIVSSFPKDAEILSVQTQNNNICVWYKFTEGTIEKEDRTFFIIGTGYRIRRQHNYLATCILDNGLLVMHVFEVDKTI